MIYTISNPSDPYTMEAESDAVAAVAGIFIGRGHYPIKSTDNRTVCPFRVTGEWFKDTYGQELDEFIESNLLTIADCLDSVLIGSALDREAYGRLLTLENTPENKLRFRDKWHNQRRSSMNDIGACAWATAKILRECIAEEE